MSPHLVETAVAFWSFLAGFGLDMATQTPVHLFWVSVSRKPSRMMQSAFSLVVHDIKSSAALKVQPAVMATSCVTVAGGVLCFYSHATPNYNKMLVIYDGQSPFCKNYIQLNRLRDAAGKIELIDARSQNSVIEHLRTLGYDLNEGMAVIWAGNVYYGKDAVVLISSMTGNRRWAARLIRALLRSPARASFFYPILKAGRRLTLNILGRPPIS